MLKNLSMSNVFDFPKPLGFIEELLTIGTDSNSIILEFFSGSGNFLTETYLTKR